MQKLNNLIGYDDFGSEMLNPKKKATKHTDTSKDVLTENHIVLDTISNDFEKHLNYIEYVLKNFCNSKVMSKKDLQEIYDIIEKKLKSLGYDPALIYNKYMQDMNPKSPYMESSSNNGLNDNRI